MPNTTSNTVLYSSLVQQPMTVISIPSGTAINTITQVITASSKNTLVVDVCFRVANAITFDIIICTTGNQATALPNTRATIAANSGNNGTADLASLSSICPRLFSRIDLAGNKVFELPAGYSVYVQNTAATSGIIYITPIAVDF